MTGPSGNSEFCFPSTLNVPSGKQNSQFPSGPVIKCLLLVYTHSVILVIEAIWLVCYMWLISILFTCYRVNKVWSRWKQYGRRKLAFCREYKKTLYQKLRNLAWNFPKDITDLLPFDFRAASAHVLGNHSFHLGSVKILPVFTSISTSYFCCRNEAFVVRN